MGFSRQEYWDELSLPSSGDLPLQGSNPRLLCLLHGAGRFFITSAPWEVHRLWSTAVMSKWASRSEFLLWTDGGWGWCDERLGFFLSFYRKTFMECPLPLYPTPVNSPLLTRKGCLSFPVKSLLSRPGLCLPMDIEGTS